jgi:putative nucleotidyltransferase with HDIG domain
MPARVTLFVWSVVGASIVVLFALGATAALGVRADWLATLAFATLGLLAYAFAHDLGKAAAGSVAFLPWLAAIFTSPVLQTVLVLGTAVAVGELYRKKTALKATFNVSQYVLSFGLAALSYKIFGGLGDRVHESLHFLAYVAGCLTFYVTNVGLVSVVVGLSEGRSIIDVWRTTLRTNAINDLVAIPVVIGFIAVFERVGVVGIAALAILLLGVRQLYKTNAQLQVTNAELLEVLVHAMELRDPYTSGHSQRVARYARSIGRALGFSTKQIERLSIAALLHDVGKIDQVFVPILAKVGSLTMQERATMEQHPIKSAELVSKVSELADVVAPIRGHHEAWDGTGYPDQLSGNDIPLFSRVIAFADTMDAMLTDRPYRKALSGVQVLAELKRCRGTQFDPEMCDVLMASDAFLALLDRPTSTPTVVAALSGRNLDVRDESILAVT